MTILTRTKLDATDLYALEFIKCILSQRPDFSNNKKLISECYGLADELYEEWEKRFAKMEKAEELAESL